MSRIYVASSWRCAAQPAVVAALREAHHEVYDFKNPAGATGFHWSEVGVNSSGESAVAYIAGLEHPRAVAGFASDFDAMQWADTCVLVLPCGRSAHLELGWCAGAGKRTAVLLDVDPVTPELMYLLCDYIAPSLATLIAWSREVPACA